MEYLLFKGLLFITQYSHFNQMISFCSYIKGGKSGMMIHKAINFVGGSDINNSIITRIYNKSNFSKETLAIGYYSINITLRVSKIFIE